MARDEKQDVVDAFKSIQLQDFKDIGKIPCSRNALLYGIGTGTGIGVVRFLAKRSVPTAANWAVATFCGVAALSFELCTLDRKAKMQKLRTIVKAADSRGKESLIVDERGRNGAFHVVVDTPSVSEQDSSSS